MDPTDKQNLYDKFLEVWPEERVRSMKLSEYVDVGNHQTFCYWIERETRYLGSILGSPAIKFGIYKRKPGKAPIPSYANDSEYSWRPFHGSTRDAAFRSIRNQILKVINLSEEGAFSEIDQVQLSPMFKWKIAFLYSNERLVPIYEEKVLRRIGEHLGIRGDRFSISAIQELMVHNKPGDLNIYEYMEKLWFEFKDAGDDSETDKRSETLTTTSQRRIKRKAANRLNTDSQLRSVTRSYLVEQKHNKLQELLFGKLVTRFGVGNVLLEKDFVDIKLIQPDSITLYDVKSSSYALACVREAVGQLLFYSIRDEDPRPKRLVVVGQYPPNQDETRFIEKLSEHLRLELVYEYVSLN